MAKSVTSISGARLGWDLAVFADAPMHHKIFPGHRKHSLPGEAEEETAKCCHECTGKIVPSYYQSNKRQASQRQRVIWAGMRVGSLLETEVTENKPMQPTQKYAV